jgi:hypothetical protein
VRSVELGAMDVEAFFRPWESTISSFDADKSIHRQWGQFVQDEEVPSRVDVRDRRIFRETPSGLECRCAARGKLFEGLQSIDWLDAVKQGMALGDPGDRFGQGVAARRFPEDRLSFGLGRHVSR